MNNSFVEVDRDTSSLGLQDSLPSFVSFCCVSKDFNQGVDADMQQLRPIKNEINLDLTHERISCILSSIETKLMAEDPQNI